MSWYKITSRETHCKGKKGSQVIYMWGGDIITILDRYKELGGVARDRIPTEMRPLNQEEASILEKTIVRDMNLNLEEARKKPIRYYLSMPPV